jgi:hypothetical protein
MTDMINKRKGSFTLEIALIMPVVFVLLFCFIWQMSAVRTEMFFKSILIKETEKSSLIGILYEYSDTIYSNMANDKSVNTTKGNSDSQISEFLFDSTYELVFKAQFEEHYKILMSNNKSFKSLLIDNKIYFEREVYGRQVFLTSRYKIYTPYKVIAKTFTIPLRLWSNGDNSNTTKSADETNIWKQGNFQRGEILRRRFGGNMPFGFPVLSGFQNNCALVIKSMDLTKPTWKLPEIVQEKMESELHLLANYSGCLFPWGKDGISIRPEDIHSRYIKFIFPENIDLKVYDDVFTDVRNQGLLNNIQVEYIFFQKSD